ncbi:MAG: nucleotidyltransferase [Candidatus Giovannonibacteria bacterium]|nr:MAG: nucleotidyltransferase [Candidatus Giovannonibacteria bacterium]
MEQIDPRRLLVNVAQILERLNIPYIITGGIAVLVWGRPRFTADIDIVVELKTSDISKLEKALRELSGAGYIDKQSIEKAILQEGEFNFVDGETGVKVDFWMLKRNAFDVSRLRRKIAKEILGQKVYFSSPEDLILIKLQWFKESGSSRQLEDVESILKISGSELDIEYLKMWALRIGVAEMLEKLLIKKI